MANGVKSAHDIMLSTGLLTYFSMGDLTSISKGTVDVGAGFIDGAWNGNDDKFREMGHSIGEVTTSIGMAGMNADMMIHATRKFGWGNALLGQGAGIGPWRVPAHGAVDAKSILGKDGVSSIFHEMKDGTHQYAGKIIEGEFQPFKGTSKAVAEGKTFSKMAKGGVLRSGKFVADYSLLRGAAPMIAAFAFGYAAKGILGFAGSIVDESVRDFRREKSVHYDNRFFNTQRNEMSNLQTLGAAMNNYESRFQSTSRIFHSR